MESIYTTINITEELSIVKFECFINNNFKVETGCWLTLYDDDLKELDTWDSEAYILDLYKWLSKETLTMFKKKHLKRDLKEFCNENKLDYRLYKETILNVLKKANKLKLLKIKL